MRTSTHYQRLVAQHGPTFGRQEATAMRPIQFVHGGTQGGTIGTTVSHHEPARPPSQDEAPEPDYEDLEAEE